MDGPLYTIFSNLLYDLPSHIVRIVGIVLCIAYWRRYPRACLLTLIAMLLFFFQTAIAIGINLWIQGAGRRASITTQDIASYYKVSGIFQSIIRAAGFGLLFAAIFLRNERPNTT
jgi:hypothetical protein